MGDWIKHELKLKWQQQQELQLLISLLFTYNTQTVVLVCVCMCVYSNNKPNCVLVSPPAALLRERENLSCALSKFGSQFEALLAPYAAAHDIMSCMYTLCWRRRRPQQRRTVMCKDVSVSSYYITTTTRTNTSLACQEESKIIQNAPTCLRVECVCVCVFRICVHYLCLCVSFLFSTNL